MNTLLCDPKDPDRSLISFFFNVVQVGNVFWSHSNLRYVRTCMLYCLVFSKSSFSLQRKRPGTSFLIGQEIYWQNPLKCLPCFGILTLLQVFRATIFASFLALLLAIFSGILQVTGTNPNFTASLLVTFSLALSLVTVSSVVLPKIIRIASGEKVVVTKVLRDVNGLKAEHRTDGRTNIDVVQESGDSSTVVVIKAGQPVPEKFENDLRRLREVLSSLEDISNQARPLNQAHWFALKKATALVSHDIDHYQFEWDDRGEWRESP